MPAPPRPPKAHPGYCCPRCRGPVTAAEQYVGPARTPLVKLVCGLCPVVRGHWGERLGWPPYQRAS